MMREAGSSASVASTPRVIIRWTISAARYPISYSRCTIVAWIAPRRSSATVAEKRIERDELELSAPANLPRGAAPGRPAAVRHPEGAGDVRPLLEGRPRELRPALVVVVVVLVGGSTVNSAPSIAAQNPSMRSRVLIASFVGRCGATTPPLGSSRRITSPASLPAATLSVPI